MPHVLEDILKIKLPRTFTLYTVIMVINRSILCAGSGGSGYSRFGVGDVRYIPSDRSTGMGGTAIALLGTNAISTLNPATWTQLNRMRFALGATYEGYSSTDGSGSSFLSGANFNGVVFALPISMEQGVVVSAGITPYSTVNYNVVTKVTEAGFTYSLQQIGEGGLSNTYLGVSARFGRDWHVGAKLNYMFGTLQHKTNQIFSVSQFTNAEVSRATRMNGVSVTFGMMYSGAGELLSFPESNSLAIGAIFTTAARMTTIRENNYEYSAGGLVTRDTINVGEGMSTLPLALGVGISYMPKDRFIVAADLFYQNWNQFILLGIHPDELRDSYRLSLGGEFLPRKEVSAGYLEKVAYRVGLFYYASNLRIDGRGINELGITGGLGLPMFGETRFSISVEYSTRGTKDLQKDNILRVSFTLSSGELWFARPPEE